MPPIWCRLAPPNVFPLCIKGRKSKNKRVGLLNILKNLIEGESISDEAQQQITDEAQFNPPT